MSDTLNSRRRQAQEELGLANTREEERINHALEKEEKRRQEKERWRREIESSASYKATKNIATVMDKYFIDPIIGFFLPGIGDALTSIFVVPYIYVAACKVKSLPLTLAVIFNVLRDVALGLIPFCVGDIIDAFNRSHIQNRRLIIGFVEDDQKVISEVNRKAAWTGFMIVVFCVLIYLLVLLAIKIAEWIGGAFEGLWGLFS